jgi:hypothetical protein
MKLNYTDVGLLIKNKKQRRFETIPVTHLIFLLSSPNMLSLCEAKK